jgi:hypothetical protein
MTPSNNNNNQQKDFFVAFLVRFLDGTLYETSSSSSAQTASFASGTEISGVGGSMGVSLDSNQRFKGAMRRQGALGATYVLFHVVCERQQGRSNIFTKMMPWLPRVSGPPTIRLK